MSVPTHGPDCKTKTYPMKCRVCNAEVFHYACSCGTSILFDDLGSFNLHALHQGQNWDNDRTLPLPARIRIRARQSKPLLAALAPALANWLPRCCHEKFGDARPRAVRVVCHRWL